MFLDRILSMTDVANGRGLEIGPLNRPMITRDMGPVEYIDRASREELQASYGRSGDVDPEAIVEVDHIWGAQTLLECVGGARTYDYLIASHVIEHTPDLFGWLREIASVLVDGGVAAFRVPDKRATFDRPRQVSGGGQMIAAYLRGQRAPDAQQVFDCFHYGRDAQSPGAYPTGVLATEEAITTSARHLTDLCRGVTERGDYIDAHCWVFTPDSMVDALDLASRLGILPFEILALEQPDLTWAEFLLVLRRLPDDLSPEAQRAAFVASRERCSLPPPAPAGAEPVEAAPASREYEHAVARLAAIEASTSWRITAPLRAAVTMARRMIRRA
jgi:hypothetical protein